MSPKTYAVTTCIVFSLIAFVQLARLVLRWEVLLNGRPVPLWVSAIAILLAGYLAFAGFRVARRSDGSTS
jgi:hypothetical protein